MYKIAIIGTGNVGGALATGFAKAGHTVLLGVKDAENFKGKNLLDNPNTTLHSIETAVTMADIIVVATPATAAVEVAQSLGDTTGKIIIDTMNIVMGRGPAGFTNTTDAILAHTHTRDVVKCFNTTGFENTTNPIYHEHGIDMFVAGDSAVGKAAATQLAQDIGFGTIHDMGGNDKFFLAEQLANVWINQAIFQKNGRDMAIQFVYR